MAVNKSEEIRRVANELKLRGEIVRPKSILDILKKQGIDVAPPQVSIVLKKSGLRPKQKVQSAAPKVVLAAKSEKPSAAQGRAVNIDDLIAAKKFAVQFGGVQKAITALSALNRLS